MHYFIDGYNLMFYLNLAEDELSVQRDQVISDLHRKIELLNLDVTIVFDAAYRFGLGQRTHLKNLEICFTDEGESADDYIIRKLESVRNAKNETVVTSDNKLAWRARNFLANTVAVDKFVDWLNLRYKKKGGRWKKTKEVSKPTPPKKTQEEVTSYKGSEEEFNYYLGIFEKKFKEITNKKNQ